MKRSSIKLTCVTSSNTGAQNSSSTSDKSSQRSRTGDAGANAKSASALSSKELAKSPSKKTSKHLDARSPTKKSLDYLSKIAAADENAAENSKGDISSPGIRKYTRDISDVAGKRLPHIPEHEIQEFMVEEDLSEIERVKILLKKDNNDQLSYFFNNIESIFRINRPQYHSLFGNDYDSAKQRAKNHRFNYETQSRYGNFLKVQTSIRSKDRDLAVLQQQSSSNDPSKLKVREIVVDGGDEEADDETKESEKRSQNQQQPGSAVADQAQTQKQNQMAGMASNDDGRQAEDAARTEYQLQLQEQVLPMILENKWIESQSEYMQILTGESFLALLKSNQVQLTEQVLMQIKDEAIQMLQQWSADILEIWTEVYTLALAALTKLKRQSGDTKDLESTYLECKQTVQKMSDRNQTIKVRMKAASLVGQLAKYDSVGDPERFRQFFLQKLQYQCQDLHWEVRKEMCSHLIYVSRYIGQSMAEEKVLPEIKELLEDEEGEVVTEAIVQFQKHIATVFSLKYAKSQEALDIFYKFCDLALENDMCGIDLAIVLKKLGKIIVTFDKPKEKQVAKKIEDLIILAKKPNQDEEIRAMIPCTFEAIIYLYRDNLQILLEFFEKHFSSFIYNEIKKGQKDKKKDKVDSARSSSKGILYDLLENEKQSKYYREDTNDLNYLVNRSIAQNLHFFFGAFVQVFKNTKSQQEQELMNELCSPSTFSVASVSTPTDLANKDSKHLVKSQTPVGGAVPFDRVRLCITEILENYRRLLQTKDQELMHHVLFSFDCFHSEVTKINVWQSTYKKGLGDGIRDLYVDIVKNYVIPAEAVVKNCWRYHLTYLKVIESLINSSEQFNEKYTQENSFDALGNRTALAHISSKVKPFNTHLTQLEALQIVFNNVYETSADLSSGSHLKVKKIKLQNQSNTSQQVRSYAFEILAKQLTQNKSSKIRGKIVDFTTRLIKFKTQGAKSAYLGVLHTLIKNDMISSKFFQQNFFDSFIQVIDDNSTNQNHLKVLRDFSRKIMPLIYEDALQLDKFNTQISFLKQRCESQTTYAPTNKIMKRGNVANLILQEIEDFQVHMKRKQLKEEIKEYLRTIDHENLIKEDILNGVYMPKSGNSRDFQSIKDEYVSSRVNLLKNSSRTNLSRPENAKKPFSVRASSKGANREKRLPPTTSNKEKINIPSSVSAATTGHHTIKENKTIQQTFEVLDQQQDGKRRLKSLRPPSQPYQRRSVLPTVNMKDMARQQTQLQQASSVARAQESSQSPRVGLTQQPSPTQRRAIGNRKHNSNMDVMSSWQANLGRAGNGQQKYDLMLPADKPPKMNRKSDPKKLEESDTSGSEEENGQVKVVSSKMVVEGISSNPNKQRRLSSLSAALSDQENEGSSNATHSEKITKKKSVIVDNHDQGASSLATKTSGVNSTSASTKMLPPRTKGVLPQNKPNMAPSQLLVKNEEADLFLDQKINVLDQYRTAERGMCYTNIIGSDQLLIQASTDQNRKAFDSQSSASSALKRAQLQHKDQNGPILFKDTRNSKSTLSKFNDAKNARNLDHNGAHGLPVHSRATYQKIMNNALNPHNPPNEVSRRGNIQLNNKISNKQEPAPKQPQSQQATIESNAAIQAAINHMRPGSSHYDPISSSYFQRNSKLQERRSDVRNATQKLVTPTNIQQNALGKDDGHSLKPTLQAIQLSKPPNTIDMLKSKNNDAFSPGGAQTAPQSGLLKNSKNVNLQLHQRRINQQGHALDSQKYSQVPIIDSLEQKFSQFKAETGLVSAFTQKQSAAAAGEQQAALPQRQRLKSLNMNQMAGSKQFSHLQSAQSSQVNLLCANTPLPDTITPLPRIETKEPKTLENNKEPFGLNPKAVELFSSNPIEEPSPQFKNDKLDGTLLTREIVKSTHVKADREPAKAPSKFGAPKEYRPPLGAGAPILTSGMRGGIGQGLTSQYQMKQQQMHKNASKSNLLHSHNATEAKSQPVSAGLSKNQQKANKRNSDLKKNNQSMLGYLAGTALSRPMTNGAKSNPIRGAFGTGYKRS